MRAARREAKAAHGLILRDELKARQRVLRRLNHVDSQGVITVQVCVCVCVWRGEGGFGPAGGPRGRAGL